MPIFVVTGFPASYDPPEDESIVLPPGAGRRFKGVPFGVTEDTAAVLRTLSYVEELTEESEEDTAVDPSPIPPTDESDGSDGASAPVEPTDEPSEPVASSGPSTGKPPKPVGSDRPSKTKE